MIFYAENENFIVGVKEMGAELTSLKSKKTGIEYIWNGNVDIWYGQSPILFPIIGRLLDDKYRYNGNEYTMAKHGIVRKKPFTLISKTADTLVFQQSSDADSLKSYPFEFDLIVEFKLTDNGLSVAHTAVNKDNKVMYYSFGAHPAFNCKIGDYLEFSDNENLLTERIDHESILIEEKFPVEMDGKKIIITNDLFKDDALILSGYKSKAVTLKSNSHNRTIKFNFDSPLLGIWAKPGAPYVCIEPWWGVNDNYDKKSDISEKRAIMSLGSNESASFNWNVEICE
ncbi:MAG: aldose 1-epimerase family protein [Clostridia bacterium]|nr:aldose 1-epimerase family protein [Clostridia bacterium]